jgi:hypothetical protein
VPIYDWILPNGKFGKSSGKTTVLELDGKSTAFGLEIATGMEDDESTNSTQLARQV